MGGLIQLVAYGEQDVYLTGDPKVTFFQAVYKRHTNFAIECIQQTINGSTVTNGARIAVVVARSGDLIGEMYIDLLSNIALQSYSNTVSGYSNVASTFDGTSWMAERAIADVELTIGGQKIDKHFQRWWRLYSELYLPQDKKIQYGKMTSLPHLQIADTSYTSNAAGQVILPLFFSFNRNPGMYLPLIALQYHEVRLDFDISQEFQTYFNGSYFNVWGNYVFLDTEERKMFAQKKHDYLIEQLQYTGAAPITTATSLSRITYNHPVKELVWCITQNKSTGKTLWDLSNTASQNNTLFITPSSNVFNGTSNVLLPISSACGNPMQLITYPVAGYPSSYQWCEGGNQPGTSYGPIAQFKLIINGQDRMKAQSGKYFNQMQPFNHHTGNPYPGIYSYSFALKPEEHQPSGTCNFSRVDNSQAYITLKTGFVNPSFLEMFAVNYNVLRIQSGMGGLAFSN